MNDRRPARRPPALARGARAARPPRPRVTTAATKRAAAAPSVRRVRPSLGLPTPGPARRCPRSPARPHTNVRYFSVASAS